MSEYSYRTCGSDGEWQKRYAGDYRRRRRRGVRAQANASLPASSVQYF